MNIILIRLGKRNIINPSVGQPLGIMYLASYLQKYRKNKDLLTLIDMKLHNYDIPTLVELAMKKKPDIIGLSCFTPDSAILYSVANELRNMGFKGKIIAGGPHSTADPFDVLKNKNINIAVLGEGEETFLRLVDAIEKDAPIKDIQGIAFINHDCLTINKKENFIQNMDSIPFPAWHLIEFEKYYKYFSNAPLGKRRYMQIFTSRGCPYRCTYCHNIFGKFFRTRSIENVIKELTILINDYGITEFEIMDDVFNFDIERAEKILDAIASLDKKLRISFPNGLRGDRLPLSLIQKMKKAGVYFAGIAIESASPRLQKMLKKNLKLEKVKEAISLLRKEGIYTNGFLMFGFPTETKEDMKETFCFARASDLDIAQVFVLNPFKGTELYSQIFEDDKSVNRLIFDYNVTPINYNTLKYKEFSHILWKGYIIFYLTRFRFVRSFIKYPRKRYFLHYILLVFVRIVYHFYNKYKFAKLKPTVLKGKFAEDGLKSI